ncbi:MAG: hypothetical protein GY820_09840, partial [Gammaproteobacteria bacterium]|nr:hypothetical protein [Gammaproteobacteria bacterium]
MPSEWKDAIVTPVPKVSAPTCPAAFRPISLLPIVSKEMERIILSILLPYVGKSFPDFQYGFRRGKSTVDCLSFVVHDLARCIDKHKKVVGVFFDVKKAFDKCVHTV